MNKLRIVRDSTPFNPRTNWDNLCTLVWAHKRYVFGENDKNVNLTKPRDFVDSWNDAIVYYFADNYTKKFPILKDWDGYELSNRQYKAVQNWMDSNVFIKGVYMYEHSGVTVKTSPFSCRWDSGQLGYIYLTKEEAKKQLGIKRFTKKQQQNIYGYLEGEIETFDDYLTGNVYGFIVENEEGEEIDSCWGFYGDNHMKNGISDHVSHHFEGENLEEIIDNVEVEY
jgi:hypothetical protein